MVIASVNSAWKGSTAGGCHNHATHGDNPQFLLKIQRRDAVTITLTQHGTEVFPISLSVLDVGERITIKRGGMEIGNSGSFTNAARVQWSGTLGPGVFVLLPSTFDPGCEADITVSVESGQPVNLAEIVAYNPTAGLLHETVIESEWMGETAGGCVNFPTYTNNPQFLLHLVEPSTRVHLVLEQLQPEKHLHSIGAFIAYVDGGQVVALTRANKVADTGTYISFKEASCTTTLDKREHPYTILPTTFNPGEQGGFRIKVFSDKTVTLTNVEGSKAAGLVHDVSALGVWEGESAGGSHNNPTFGNNPQFLLDIKVPTQVSITLKQANKDGKTHAICVYVLDKQGKRAKNLMKGDTVLSSGQFLTAKEVICNGILEPKSYPYTVLVTTYGVNDEGAFKISVASDQPLRALVPLENTSSSANLPYHASTTGEWKGDTAGGSLCSPTIGQNPQWLLHVTSATRVMVALKILRASGEGSLMDLPQVTQAMTVVVQSAKNLLSEADQHASLMTLVSAAKALLTMIEETHPVLSNRLVEEIQKFVKLVRGNPPPHELRRATVAFMALLKDELSNEPAGGGSSNVQIGVALVENEGYKLTTVAYHDQIVADSGPFSAVAETSFEATLSPSLNPLTIVPSTFEPGSEALFSVTVRADQPISLTEAPLRADPSASLPHQQTFDGEWRGMTAGGCVNYPATCINNPQFFMFVTKPTQAYFVVEQHTEGEDLHHIGVLVADKAGKKVASITHSEEIASSDAFSQRLEVRCGAMLPPSETPYTIVPSTHTPGQEGTFTLSVRTDAPVRIEPALQNFLDPSLKALTNTTRVEGEWGVGTAGGCCNFPTFMLNPHFALYIEEDTDVLVTLTQRSVDRNIPSVGFSIVDSGGEFVQRLESEQEVASSGAYKPELAVEWRGHLPARLYPYIVIPSTFEPWVFASFTLEVNARSPVRLLAKVREDTEEMTPAEEVEEPPSPRLPAIPILACQFDEASGMESDDEALHSHRSRRVSVDSTTVPEPAAPAPRVLPTLEEEEDDWPESPAITPAGAGPSSGTFPEDPAGANESSKEREPAARISARLSGVDTLDGSHGESEDSAAGSVRSASGGTPAEESTPVEAPASEDDEDMDSVDRELASMDAALDDALGDIIALDALLAEVEEMKAGRRSQSISSARKSSLCVSAESPPAAKKKSRRAAPTLDKARLRTPESTPADSVDAASVATPKAPLHRRATMNMNGPKKKPTFSDMQSVSNIISRIFNNNRSNDDWRKMLVNPLEPMLDIFSRTLTADVASQFSIPLIAIFRHDNLELDLCKRLIDAHVLSSPPGNAAVLFRGNTLATKTLTNIMKDVGQGYLEDILVPSLKEIWECPKMLQVDARQFPDLSTQQRLENVDTLIKLLDATCDRIFSKTNECPKTIRMMAHYMQEGVAEKYNDPEFNGAASVVVGGHVFLRFFCPAIVTPKNFRLSLPNPDSDVMPAAVLLSKTLQRLANGTKFNGSDDYHAAMNTWLASKKAPLRAFLKEFSSLDHMTVDSKKDGPLADDELAGHVKQARDIVESQRLQIISRLSEPYMTSKPSGSQSRATKAEARSFKARFNALAKGIGNNSKRVTKAFVK